MASEDQIARLRLVRSDNIGPVTYFQLLARFGCAQAAIDAIPDLAARGGGRAPKLAARAAVEREMERVAALGARYLFLGQGLYPPLLAELESAPPALIVKGHLTLLDRVAIAMVGARNASAAACRFARQLAQALGAADHVIVSGLARGIDTAAHDGALETGTIAVIAGGIDIAYRRKMRRGSRRSPNAACWSRSSRRASSRAPGTSLIATASSPASRKARSWSRPRPSPAR